MSRKNLDPRQLDFDDAARQRQADAKALYEQCMGELRANLRSIHPDLLGPLSPRRRSQVFELLAGVESYVRGLDGRCVVEAKELLASVRKRSDVIASLDQLYAARRDAERLELLAIWRMYDDQGARLPDQLCVRYDRIDALLANTRSLARGQPTSNSLNQPQVTSTDFKQPRALEARAPKSPPKGDSERITLNQSSFSLPSETVQRTADTRAPAPGARSTLRDWFEAEEEVFSCGVDDARNAIAAARSRGAGPADVGALVDWWRPRRAAWDHPEAVLWKRLKRFSRDLTVDRGWSPTRVGWVDPATAAALSAAAEARQAARRREQAAREQATAAAAQFAASLEALVGPAVDALSDEQIAELLSDNGPLLAAWRRSGKKRTGLFREALIERVAARRAPA